MKRILSLDGGGMRGVLTMRLIERLGQKYQRWWKEADIIGGASIGAINAIGLAFGKEPAELISLFKDRGPDIFASRGLLDSVSPDEVWRANYLNTSLRKELKNLFGEAKLKDLPQRVLVATFNLDKFQPEFLDSDDEEFNDMMLVDACLVTSAAPTYFPSHMGFCDGGVAANNPSDCVVAELIADGEQVKHMSLLSIGTGENPRSLEGGDWGYRQWLPHLLPMFMEGPMKAAEYRTRMMLGDRHLRVQPKLQRIIDLDDGEAGEELIMIADGFDLNRTEEWLRLFWSDDSPA